MKKIILAIVICLISTFIIIKYVETKDLQGTMIYYLRDKDGVYASYLDKGAFFNFPSELSNLFYDDEGTTILGSMNDAIFSYDEANLIGAVYNKLVVYDYKNKLVIHEIPVNIEKSVSNIKTAPNGKFISYVEGETLKIWNTHDEILTKVDFGTTHYDWYDSQTLISNKSGNIELYDVLEARTYKSNFSINGDFLDLSADKTTILCRVNSNFVRIENIIAKEILDVKVDSNRDCAISPDGKFIAYLTPRIFTKFAKDLIIVNLKGKRVHKIGNCSSISDWK